MKSKVFKIMHVILVGLFMLLLCSVVGCDNGEHEHTFSNWYTMKEATCELEGEEVRACSKCGEVEERLIAKTGHVAGDWIITRQPTCDRLGERKKECIYCNATVKTGSIAKTTHEYSEWHVSKVPTCQKEGLEIRECSNCDGYETKTIDKLQHVISTNYIIDREPTCNTTGLKHKECVNCHMTMGEVVVIAKVDNHSYGEWITKTPATCTTAEVEISTCSVCGISQERTGDEGAKGHNHSELVDTIAETWNTPKTYVKRCINNNCADEISVTEGKSINERIAKLESLATAYVNDVDGASGLDPNKLVLEYIRSTKYNSGSWNLICGSANSAFAEYVANSNTEDFNVEDLKSIETFVINTLDGSVDFVHMFAVMDAILSGNSNFAETVQSMITSKNVYDLTGWGGDLITLINDMKSNSITDIATIKATFENNTTSFGNADINSDMDGYNIMQIYNDMEYKSIIGAMREYYATINNATRKSDFVSSNFASEYASANTSDTLNMTSLVNAVVTRLSSNILIHVPTYLQSVATMAGVEGLADGLHINFDTDIDYINACTEAMLSYILGI